MNNTRTKKKTNSITRHISKDIRLLRKTNYYRSHRSAFLISDSKGKDLQLVKEAKRLKFYYRGGAEITNPNITSYARHILSNKRNRYPVILFWFGTCSLTHKVNNLFVLRDNITAVVDNVIADYIQLKQDLQKLNPRAKIIYLECPYYKLSMFNEHRKRIFEKDLFITQQKQLIEAIDYHNKRIRDINGNVKTPNFNRDFTLRSNPKKRKPRLQIHYDLLRDGCHAGPKLSKLWLLRLQQLIYRI